MAEETTWRAVWLGQKLRDLRKAKDLNVKDVADYLECGTTTVNRFEIGTFPVKTDTLVKLMNLLGVSDRAERAALIQLAEDVAQRGWWESLVSDQAFADFVWAESRSRHICDFQSLVFSGLLQAPGYAEALIKAGSPGATADEVAKLVEARLLRGDLLRASSAPRARFLIHEAVLYQRLPDVELKVHTDQLKHLLAVSEYGNVELRLVPLSSAVHLVLGVSSSFTILEMHEPWPTLVHVETPVGAVVAEPADIDSFTSIYARLWDEGALDEKRTNDYISGILKEVQQ